MKRQLLILIFCLPASAGFDFHSKIVGGDAAENGEFPTIVSVQNRGSHVCGGTVVGKNWVLTAAHCIFSRGRRMSVVVGINKLSDKNDSNTIRVRKAYVHPKYDPSNINYDFALLKLRRSADVKVARLNETPYPENAVADFLIAGWGLTSETGFELPDQLQKVSVPFVSPQACAEAYGPLTPQMICAGYPEGGRDSCQGDSGGPLFGTDEQGAVLVGVVSWGEGCARPQKYGVYANVSEVTGWIKKHLSE